MATEAKEIEEEYLPVIGWFWKRDTMTYWIHEGAWQVSGQDTVKTLGLLTKVQVTVTDSTKHRYRMEYRFLEFAIDSTAESWAQDWVRSAVGKLQQQVVGTAIRFRTDEFGRIVKYDNLGAVRKQARKVLADVVRDLPGIDSLVPPGMDMKDVVRGVDAVNNSCFYLQYFPDGWPREVIYQEGVTIGDRGKLKQTYIEWDYRSVGHTN